MDYYRQFNSEGHTYALGPTKWTDRTEGEISLALNLKPEMPNTTTLASLRAIRSQNPKSGDVAAPTTFDWRPFGVSPIKDQGNCGSCWAFAAVGGAESYMMIQGNASYDLSEEYALECSGSRDSCAGGYMQDVMPLIFSKGLPL